MADMIERTMGGSKDRPFQQDNSMKRITGRVKYKRRGVIRHPSSTSSSCPTTSTSSLAFKTLHPPIHLHLPASHSCYYVFQQIQPYLHSPHRWFKQWRSQRLAFCPRPGPTQSQWVHDCLCSQGSKPPKRQILISFQTAHSMVQSLVNVPRAVFLGLADCAHALFGTIKGISGV